jgi:N-acetyltransferase
MTMPNQVVSPAPVVLAGTHISLVPLAPPPASHAAELFALASPSLFEHLLQRPREWSLAGFEALVGRLLSQPRASWVMVLNAPAGGTALQSRVEYPQPSALESRATQAGQAIGHTSFLNIKPEHKTLEIGTTWISEAHHGTAVNPESKLLLMRHAFETLGYQRVEFLVSTRNLRSQAAVAKLGAVREGVLRSRWVAPDGTPRDVVCFSVIAEEWPGVRAGLERRVATIHAAG